MTAEEIRRRLVEIDDELRALPDDAFAAKHLLSSEGDDCRRRLRAMLSGDLDAASDDWAERAGHKGEHSVDEGEQATAGIRITRGFTSEGQG